MENIYAIETLVSTKEFKKIPSPIFYPSNELDISDNVSSL